jgi:60 kDa SS-A/Ro ribonucleoprotein
MRINAVSRHRVNHTVTHEGALAVIPAAARQLERQVANCLLWEDSFYESGDAVARSLEANAANVRVKVLADLAIKAREQYKLRHAPLFLLAHLNKRRYEQPGLLADTVERVIQRPDEMAELLALVQKIEGKPLKKVLSHGLKKGIARAFTKFDRYQLAKYNRDGAIKLRDVMFLTHPKPIADGRGAAVVVRGNNNVRRHAGMGDTFTELAEGILESPDTWEVALSGGADKKETFTRLLEEKRLGYMALLRNLRNMSLAGVDRHLITKAIAKGSKSRVLPFRFISAAKHAPEFAGYLSDAMIEHLEQEPKLSGETIILVDVSGSMNDKLSGRSELERWEAAAALAVLVREVSETCRVYTFSNQLVEVPNYRGLPLIEKIDKSQEHQGTYLIAAVRKAVSLNSGARVIVVTDEQGHGHGGEFLPKVKSGYILNVASYAPALETTEGWTRVSGFSERIVDWISAAEV